jgi:hypothetical protein
LTKFTQLQIYQLWGELFNWAIVVINLKPSPKNSTVTRYFLFYGRKPDLRTLRLLPIFSIILAYRRPDSKKTGSDLQSRRAWWQRGLYIGPSQDVHGAVRVAVLTLQMVKFKLS